MSNTKTDRQLLEEIHSLLAKPPVTTTDELSPEAVERVMADVSKLDRTRSYTASTYPPGIFGSQFNENTGSANKAMEAQGDKALVFPRWAPDELKMMGEVYDQSRTISEVLLNTGEWLACVRYKHPVTGEYLNEVVNIPSIENLSPPSALARESLARYATADYAAEAPRIIEDARTVIHAIGDEAIVLEEISCELEPFTGQVIRKVALPLDPVSCGIQVQAPARCNWDQQGPTVEFRISVTDLALAMQSINEDSPGN